MVHRREGAEPMAIISINGGTASPVAGAIRDAAQTTGTSFEYLLTTAQIESNLNPAAQAATSSAKGLYQFIDQTWLATRAAACISTISSSATSMSIPCAGP